MSAAAQYLFVLLRQSRDTSAPRVWRRHCSAELQRHAAHLIGLGCPAPFCLECGSERGPFVESWAGRWCYGCNAALMAEARRERDYERMEQEES